MIGSGLINVSKINAAIKMHGNPNLLPFHRVVCTNGTLSLSYPFGVEIQKQRLEAEGI
jgi:alkylated DNA nucleotide flippase Atl1